MREEASAFDPASSSVFAWAVMIVRSYAVEWLRRRGKVVFRKSHIAAAGSFNLERQRDDSQKGSDGQAALALLSPEQWEVLELAFFQGISPSEISEALTLPVITVKARIRSGLLCLREALAASEQESPFAVPRSGIFRRGTQLVSGRRRDGTRLMLDICALLWSNLAVRVNSFQSRGD